MGRPHARDAKGWRGSWGGARTEAADGGTALCGRPAAGALARSWALARTCTLTGTFVLGGGFLSLTPPAVLGWGAGVTGTDQSVADTTGGGADETYLVNDSTGSGAGWVPTNTQAYPVDITTAATAPTPVTIYEASRGTGLGSIVIGGHLTAGPVGWWLKRASEHSGRHLHVHGHWARW